MTRTWLSIRVDLVSGRGQDFWPRPGRAFAASRSHTFTQLAHAIDAGFARWDQAHLYRFDFDDDAVIGGEEWIDDVEGARDGRTAKLSRLRPAERFVYEFDFGDSWEHLCTVGDARIDPVEQVGWMPTTPIPCWGWGDIPDQYGRRWDRDEGDEEASPGRDPRLKDLPPLRPWWGTARRHESGSV